MHESLGSEVVVYDGNSYLFLLLDDLHNDKYWAIAMIVGIQPGKYLIVFSENDFDTSISSFAFPNGVCLKETYENALSTYGSPIIGRVFTWVQRSIR